MKGQLDSEWRKELGQRMGHWEKADGQDKKSKEILAEPRKVVVSDRYARRQRKGTHIRCG